MKQEEEKTERERSRPPRPRLGQERRWGILGGLRRAFSCQAFSRPAQFRGRQYPGEWGLEVPGEVSRGAMGEGLMEAATAGGQGLLGAACPRRGPTGS